jgi:oligogalacturonide transport system substrate-binding protein
MKLTKKILSLLLIAAMSASLVACTATKSDTNNGGDTPNTGENNTQNPGDGEQAEINTTDDITLTMSWWGGDSRHEATQKAIEAFEKKYPNIHIEPTFSAWSGWEEKMGLAFSTGNAEDIVQINWNWLTAFDADGSVFRDLSQYSNVLDLSQFSEDALEQSKVNGEIHAVPISVTARTMVWNKNTFDKAGIAIPSTWEELLASGETFKNKLGDEYYPMMLTEFDRMIFMVWYLESMYGKEWVVDGQVNFTQEEIQTGLAMLAELEDKHVIPTIQMVKEYGADPIDKSDRWINGYWAGIYSWDSGIIPPRMALPEDQQAGYVTTEMFSGLPNKGGFYKISMEFAITETCEHPVEAAAFLNFLLNEEEGVLEMKGERGIPASAAGLKIAKENNILDPMIVQANDYALKSNIYPVDAYFEDAELKTSGEGLYYKVMSAHSYDQMTDEEAAKELLEGITNVLNRD